MRLVAFNLHFCSQVGTIRQWVPLSIMILSHGKPGLAALKNFVSKVPTVTIHTFKCFQSILDWDWFKSAVEYMGTSKPTVVGLTSVINKASKEQWYNWHVYHPQMPDELIHPSRSMPFLIE